MIQLTKGTNVLDINLSDFSGAGQDVVQNGSFDDIGSDLILNGDFAEIGSDLVTNGDFSAVPLTGGELVVNGNFATDTNWNKNTIWGIDAVNNKATATSSNYTTGTLLNQSGVLTEGTWYKVSFQVLEITSGNFNIRMGAGGTYTPEVTAVGTYTYYLQSTSPYPSYVYVNCSSITNGSISNVSVKEVINLVSNPNFTGVTELVDNNDFSNGTTDWSAEGSSTISVGTHEGRSNVANVNILNTSTASRIEQPFTYVDGASYKVTVEVYVVSGSFRIDCRDTFVTTDFISTTTTGEWQTLTAYITAIQSGTDVIWLRSNSPGGISQFYVDSVSIVELGEDWGVQEPTGQSVVFSNNQLHVTYDSTATQGSTGVSQLALDFSTSYKITIDVAEVSGEFKVQVGQNSQTINSPGIHTFYKTTVSTAGGDRLYIVRKTNGVSTEFKINSISVQELGEGWAFTSGASITALGAKITHTPTAGIISQYSLLVLGKNYKFTYEITENISGGLKINSAVIPEMVTTVGVHTRYFEADSTSVSIARTSAVDNDVTITNITVQEVGQDWSVGDKWTISDEGARIVSSTSAASLLTQTNVFEIGKSYKVTLDAVVNSGTAKLEKEAGAVQFLIDTTKTYVEYFEATKTSFNLNRYTSVSDIYINNITVQQLDTNGRWVTFADPASKAVLKLGQVDLEIDASGNNCGVYQTGLIKPNKLYIITINMKATAAINVEIAASLGTAVSAVIGTTALTTSYKEYSFEYVTPFAVDHDLQIHRLFGSGGEQTISIDYVSMNGVDESKWINDPTWDPFATSLVFVPTLTDESTNNSKQFTLDTSIADGGWDGRSLHGQVTINTSPTEDPANGIINLEQPDFLEGFYQVEIRGYLGTFYRILGKGMAHLERASTEDGYNRFEAYNDSVTYKAYEE